MRILAIGDPHGELEKIKKIPLGNIDLILLTGDLGNASLLRKMFFDNLERKKQGLPEKEYTPLEEKRAFMEAYNSTIKIVKYLSKHSNVYIIFGNVESSNYETKKISKRIGIKLPLLYNDLNSMKNVKIINDKTVVYKGIKIGGLEYFIDRGWVKRFKPKDREALKESTKETAQIKKILNKFGNVDILVCHQPPYGILDKVSAKFAPKEWQGKHAGSEIILDYIKKYQPKYVFCGHIHEAEGFKKLNKTNVYNLGVANYKIIQI